MSSQLLDASAVLALVNHEPGGEVVATELKSGLGIGSVNLSESVARLADAGHSETEIHDLLEPLELEVIPFSEELAYRAGLLRPLTRHAGLSFGDRACLALAQELNLPVLTADRAWATLQIGVTVRLIR